MAFPIFYNGSILFRGGALAMSTNCCCDLCPAPVSVTFQIDLSGSGATVVTDVDLTPHLGGVISPDDVLAYRLVLVFESFCCTPAPNSADNNNRFVYYSFYSCGVDTPELEAAFAEWVTATYGAPYFPFYSTPQVTVPATNAEIDTFIDAVANSAASAGDPALSVSYYRDLNFGCPC